MTAPVAAAPAQQITHSAVGPGAYAEQPNYPAASFPVRPPTSGSFGDYLAFRSLFASANAVAVFWVAEGLNAVFWIMQYVVFHYNGADAFLWSFFGFLVAAVVIRVAVEAAVAATRGGDKS